MANILDWTKFRKMIITPLIDIDNLNLSIFKPLWSLMTKGERNKDISDRGRNNKEISTWERKTKDISDISVLRW